MNAPLEADAPPDRRRKAAMIVQLLIADGQQIALSRLPEEVQVDLTRELAALRLVDKATLYAVAEEFAQELEEVGLSALGGVEGTLAALSGQISPEAQARLRREAARARSPEPWAQVTSLPAAELLPLMERESTEVAAVVLSKLPVARAAEVLGLLPGDRARRITYAVSQTAEILPETVTRIGRALFEDYCSMDEPAFVAPPVQRLGAILNSSQAATRDALLGALTETDAGFAEEVRRAIFTFPDIPARIAPLDLPRAIRGIENADMVTALAAALATGGGAAASADYILANMSQRLADSLRDEIGERGRIRKSDGEKAQGLVVAAIRARAEAGEFRFIEPDDEE